MHGHSRANRTNHLVSPPVCFLPWKWFLLLSNQQGEMMVLQTVCRACMSMLQNQKLAKCLILSCVMQLVYQLPKLATFVQHFLPFLATFSIHIRTTLVYILPFLAIICSLPLYQGTACPYIAIFGNKCSCSNQ